MRGKNLEFEFDETMQMFKLQGKTKRKAPEGELNMNEPKRRRGNVPSEEDAHSSEVADHVQVLAEENARGNLVTDSNQEDGQEP